MIIQQDIINANQSVVSIQRSNDSDNLTQRGFIKVIINSEDNIIGNAVFEMLQMAYYAGANSELINIVRNEQ